jgi:hypothetical protein
MLWLQTINTEVDMKFITLLILVLLIGSVNAVQFNATSMIDFTHGITTTPYVTFSGTAPTTTTDKLYSDAGTLKFNGVSIGGGGTSSMSTPDVIIYIEGGITKARFGINGTAVTTSTNTTTVMRAALIATPDNGSLFIDRGTYTVICNSLILVDTLLSPVTSFYFGLLTNRSINIRGDGIGATIIKMQSNQYHAGHPAVLMGARNFAYYTLQDISFDGNKAQQSPYYVDGCGDFFSWNYRMRGNYRNLEFYNSPCFGAYWGAAGTGYEMNSTFDNLKSHNNACVGMVFDGCRWDQISNIESLDDCTTVAFYGVYKIGICTSGWYFDDNTVLTNVIIQNGGMKMSSSGKLDVSNLVVNNPTGTYGLWLLNCRNCTVSAARIVAGKTTNDEGIRIETSTNICLSPGYVEGRVPLWQGGTTPTSVINGGYYKSTGGCSLYCDKGTMTLSGSYTVPYSGQYLAYSGSGATLNLMGCAASSVVAGVLATGTVNHKATLNFGLGD